MATVAAGAGLHEDVLLPATPARKTIRDERAEFPARQEGRVPAPDLFLGQFPLWSNETIESFERSSAKRALSPKTSPESSDDNLGERNSAHRPGFLTDKKMGAQVGPTLPLKISKSHRPRNMRRTQRDGICIQSADIFKPTTIRFTL
jgi:hypothetical protein